MSEIWMWLGGILTVVGALVFATAALGLLKFPDAYSRVSAVGTAGAWGSCWWSSGPWCCSRGSAMR